MKIKKLQGMSHWKRAGVVGGTVIGAGVVMVLLLSLLPIPSTSQKNADSGMVPFPKLDLSKPIPVKSAFKERAYTDENLCRTVKYSRSENGVMMPGVDTNAIQQAIRKNLIERGVMDANGQPILNRTGKMFPKNGNTFTN